MMIAESNKEMNLSDLLRNIEKEKGPEIYLKYKNIEFSEEEKKLIIANFLDNLTSQKQPSFFLNEYFKLSILKKVFPELYKLTLTLHDPVFHPEQDEMGLNTVWGHVVITLDIAKKTAMLFNLDKNETSALLLGTLIHDIGKSEVTEWEYKRGRMVVTSILHDSKGVKIGEQFLEKLGVFDKDDFPIKTIILSLIKYHHRIFELHRNRDLIKISAISKLRRDMLGYEKILILLDFADRQSRNPDPLKFSTLDLVSKWILKKRDECLAIESKPKPLIMGRDLLALGMSPGKNIGLIVKEYYLKQLSGEFSSKEEGIKSLEASLK